MTCPAHLICLTVATLSVVDGDGIRTTEQSYRLWGINAVEMHEPGGWEAKAGLQAILDGAAALTCERKGTSWDRIVARCDIEGGPHDGRDLSCVLIEQGHAVEWPRYSGGAYSGCGE